MAHFGVQKAKRKVLLALAAAASIGSVAFSSAPANAAEGDLGDFGEFSIEMDGTMPAMVRGSGDDYFAVYDMDYNQLPSSDYANKDSYYSFKLKDNDYFSCSRDYTTLNVLLKNQAGFKAFTTNSEYAEKMIRVCELATASHFAGNEAVYVAEITHDNASFNYIYTSPDVETGEQGLRLITNVPYRAEQYGLSISGSGIRVYSQVDNNGNLELSTSYIHPGSTTIELSYYDEELSMEKTYTFHINIVDGTYKDSQGNAYYLFDTVYRGTGSEVRVDARYIGTQYLALGSSTISVPEGVGLALGADKSNAVAVTGNTDPIPVTINATFGDLRSDLDILGGTSGANGSKINLTTGLESNIHVGPGSELTVMANSNQPTEDRVAIVGSDNTKLTFEGGDFGNIGIVNGHDSDLTINGGSFGQNSNAAVAVTDSLIRANTGSTVTINDGTFRQNVSEHPNDTQRIWHNDTFALLHGFSAKKITVNGGSFESNGSIISSELAGNVENPEIIVNDGYFEGKHAMAISNRWDGVTSINGGTFNTDDRFYVWDVLNDWQCSPPAGTLFNGGGDITRGCVDGEETYRHWGTGVQGYIRSLVEPTKENTVVTGGLYTDGFNPEDGSGVEPADGYGQVPYPNDNRYVIVLPQTVHDNVIVNFPETKELDLDSDNASDFEIVSIENDDSCSAEMRNGKLVVSSKNEATEVGEYCTVTVSDGETGIEVFNITVTNDVHWNQGDPMSIPVGETKVPDNFSDGKTIDDYEEWGILEGDEYCSVSDSGEITAIKGGGTCVVGAYDEDDNEIVYWYITTTEPMELEVGESKQPTDLPEGIDPTSGTWSSDDTKICTVSENGTITAKKAGTCHVSFVTEDGQLYTWVVSIKDNPNTLDKKAAISFATAGAIVGAFGAVIASIKRFGRR